MSNENVIERDDEGGGRRSMFLVCAAVVIGVAQLGWLAMLYLGVRWLIPG